MKIVKNYLTAEELSFVISSIKEHETLIEKQIIKDGIIAQMCVDEFINKENQELTCDDIYNEVAKDGILSKFKEEIVNYDLIDKMTISLEAILFYGFNDLSKKIDTVPKDFDLEQVINSLKEVIK